MGVLLEGGSGIAVREQDSEQASVLAAGASWGSQT